VNQEKHAIGIDVGGVSARVGLVSQAGRVLFQVSSRTGVHISGVQLMEKLAMATRAALEFAAERRLEVGGIGVGMPAFVDESGCVEGASNLPGINGTPVGPRLEQEFRLPVRTENDVSAGACGEYYFGGHRGRSRRMLLLAVGTGVGGGMIVDGQLLRVARGCLGDPGHIIVDVSGNSPCRCGGNGCLEAVASGWALMERAKRIGIEATPKQIFERAAAGETALAELARQAAVAVGVGLASLCVLLNPDTVALGGGVALEAGEPFRRQAEETMRAHGAPFLVRDTRVVSARAGRYAGLLGAAATVLFSAASSRGSA
jgi:glucokinase